MYAGRAGVSQRQETLLPSLLLWGNEFQLHPRELRNLQGSVIRFYQAAEDANLLGIISSFSPNSILRVQS